ncbi:MAG: TDT family transporter [Methanomassiliicoccaceae archaeon]|nr:TDT family transporter [Methanomassiliicoccaceae archaeon]
MGAAEFIKKVPVPVCGLSLGLVSLDRFLSANYQNVYPYSICALISLVIAVLFTIRMVVDRKGVAQEIKNPAVFGVLPTYTMSLMLLSTYLFPYAEEVALSVWVAAVIVSYVLMAVFIRRFFFSFGIEKVFPSWIIIFVGYVVASVTSPVFGLEDIGRMIFWSGMIGYSVMLPLTAYRTLIFRKTPEPLIPTIAIFAAPANLLIVGCLSVHDVPPEILLTILVILSVICYAAVIAYVPVMLNRRFYPSYAALTFPMVISAASFYQLGGHYGLASNDLFVILQTATAAVAVIIVVYVLVRYLMFFGKMTKGAGA